jgi:hypothetical protein
MYGLDPPTRRRLDPLRLDLLRLDPLRLDPLRLDPQRLDLLRLDLLRLDPPGCFFALSVSLSVFTLFIQSLSLKCIGAGFVILPDFICSNALS